MRTKKCKISCDETESNAFNLSRPAGSGANVQNMIPQHMRRQINQQVGQAVTNAAVNELSNVFANKFK